MITYRREWQAVQASIISVQVVTRNVMGYIDL
jgi:hypothetical protein